MYKNENKRQTGKVKTAYRALPPLLALLNKEFISVFRDPKHLFSYFSIAAAMPVMVYSCYTLFESLMINAIGMKITFSLALLVLLIFSILTNTFCATNVSRDGELALKVKMYPVKASKLLLAKVLFCSIVSSLSVVGSSALLFAAKEVEIGGKDLLIITIAGVLFSLSQIFFATRLDLDHAKVMASAQEIESESNRTI
jgi:predicted permease